jgi:pimeloyl-ACP methyl ester carboxylesterase
VTPGLEREEFTLVSTARSSTPGRRRRWFAARLVAGLILLGLAGTLTVSAPATAAPETAKPTVVLVHGAFENSAGWNEVVSRLLRDGYPVIAPANPLRSVAADSAYLASVLQSIQGPIILVGHSYGGFVMTNAATGNPNVKALVYVAAFAPDQGDTVGGLSGMFPGSKLGPAALDLRHYPLPDGTFSADAYVRTSVFHDVFAGDLPAATAAVLAATQRPADVHTLEQPAGAPAWKTIPSWYLVARADNAIPAAAQRFMAKRAGAHVVEVDASHVAMMSKPDATVGMITEAAKAVR